MKKQERFFYFRNDGTPYPKTEHMWNLRSLFVVTTTRLCCRRQPQAAEQRKSHNINWGKSTKGDFTTSWVESFGYCSFENAMG